MFLHLQLVLEKKDQYLEKQFEFFGVKIDDEKNKIRGEEVEISSEDSRVKVYVVPTNEELMIARETMNIVNKN